MTEKKKKNLTFMNKLLKPFPKEALAPLKKGKGFYLTTIKAQWVVERLNEVFGPCGIGWKYTTKFCREDSYVLAHVNLQYKVNGEWSEIIQGTGGHKINPELADAYKSAETDAITKIASKLGIGNDVFKGKVNPNSLKTVNIVEEAKKEIKKIKKAKKKVKADVETGEVLNDDEVIAEARKKLWEIVQDNGMSVEDAKKFINRSYGKKSSAELNLDQINDAISFLKA